MTHPDRTAQLRAATTRPGMLDNVCQMLFGLSGLHTPYYHPKRDMLSPLYERPRRVINDAIDCDSLLKSVAE